MKKINVFIVLFSLFVFSCNRTDELDSKTMSLFERGMLKVDKSETVANTKITKQLFIYGVKSYTINANGVLKFNTYRNFNINNSTGNISDFSFIFKENVLKMDNNYEIGFFNDEVLVRTPDAVYVFNQDLDWRQLNFQTKMMINVFLEFYISNEYKNEYEEYVNQSKISVPCSWKDTYYVSGWGMTTDAAWSDYEYEMDNSGIPKRCKSIGSPRIKTMYVDLGFTQIDFYQVDHPFCCN